MVTGGCGNPARPRPPVGGPPRPRRDRPARRTCATSLPDGAGNHPRKGDDDPRGLGQNPKCHLEQKGRGNGHSSWVYWAPFFLAVGALPLDVPGLPGPAPQPEPARGRPAPPV